MKKTIITLFVLILCLIGVRMALAEDRIVHDGVFEFLRQQHGEKWDAEDKEIDQMLADIREKNGGKRHNIL